MKHFVFTSALVLIGAIMTGQVQGDEPKIGEPAPAFSLNGSDGKTYGLAEFKDKQAVVIAWYPKAFTGG